MSYFKSLLKVEDVRDISNQGRGSWKLIQEPLVYSESKIVPFDITVPVGFITDFASIPRLPFIFWLFGDRACEESALHDYLYTAPHLTTRKQADDIFYEAMRNSGYSNWVAFPMWFGVRLFGASHWSK